MNERESRIKRCLNSLREIVFRNNNAIRNGTEKEKILLADLKDKGQKPMFGYIPHEITHAQLMYEIQMQGEIMLLSKV